LKSRGLTLLEVLVTAALALLIGGLILQFIMDLFRTSARATTHDGLQSRATILLSRLSSELSQATLPSLALKPDAVAFTRLLTLTGTGQRVWEEKSRVYSWESESKTLWFQECPPLPAGLTLVYTPTRPPHISDLALERIADPTNGTMTPLSDGVTNFVLTQEGDVIRLTLALEAPAHDNRVERFELRKTVGLRN
jgi:hypothetical protein